MPSDVCKPVSVVLVNRSNTRVVSVDLTFYLYEYPMGGTNTWEGPYRKAVSIPAYDGTRVPYNVTVDVCPQVRNRWATNPGRPDHSVQLTWRWEGQSALS